MFIYERELPYAPFSSFSVENEKSSTWCGRRANYLDIFSKFALGRWVSENLFLQGTPHCFAAALIEDLSSEAICCFLWRNVGAKSN
jgi:hypothetical protein